MPAKTQPKPSAGAKTANTIDSLLQYPKAAKKAQSSQAPAPLNCSESISQYLRHRLPGYPFNTELDADYVQELVDDFPDINILAEIKAFRWYYNNKPFSGSKKPRVALRRWLENAWPAA